MELRFLREQVNISTTEGVSYKVGGVFKMSRLGPMILNTSSHIQISYHYLSRWGLQYRAVDDMMGEKRYYNLFSAQ